jgi:transcriptional regulator with XRE-family HTH domain
MRAYSAAPRPALKHPKPARDVNQHVAGRLKTLRRTRNKTQTDLGAALGITFQQVAQYERGHSKITPSALWRAAQYFQVDIGYFFADLDRAAPAPDRRGAVEPRAMLRIELVMALCHAAIDRDLLRGLRDLLRAHLSGERAAGRIE